MAKYVIFLPVVRAKNGGHLGIHGGGQVEVFYYGAIGLLVP
jgi:hypothetical protein